MAYLSKETLLSAYKVLSTLSDDPTLQGATQKVSAIRYFLALDMFYKKYNRECNTRNSDDKTAFIDFVNTIVAVDNCYTTNFYAPLAFHQGDSAVGSNFYSVGAVKNSLTNPAIKINYPQRGSKPLFEIQNGVLFEREDLLQNFDFYVPNNKFKCALVLWICRERYVRIEDIYSTLKTQIDILFTEKTAEILLPSEDYFVEATQDIGISAEFTKANITSEDIQKLFYKNEMKKQTSLPLQQIFYGAPGTGKSHETNRVTRVYRDTIRTTFHPDSDYSTFVGAYKPTTTREFVYGLNGGNTIAFIDPNTNKPLETSKIEYKFVKQAFLKAYILAWKKMCKRSFTFTDPAGSKFTITSVSDIEVEIHKEEIVRKQSIKNTWEQAWKNTGFNPKHEGGSGNALWASIAQWIHDKMQNRSKEKFEEGWKILLDQLKNSNSIKTSTDGGNQTYNVKLKDDTSLIVTSIQNPKKNTIKEPNTNKRVIKGVVDILKNYNLPFDEAWLRLKEDVNNNEGGNYIPPQFLVIEEINRGNCAQIFGDIFQLLDRKGGYSEYPIEADEDIKKALLEDNPADGLSFGSTGLQLSDEIKEELKTLYNDSVDDIVSKICMGDVLVLPKNLYIWATMNTSDQSLFPIDSAFKRRWDWKYMPIQKPANKDWKIQVNDLKLGTIEYDWWKFVKAINDVINVVTSSEDKKLGYFFCKPCDDKNITASQFVNKVIFYLWNDVLKDYEMPKEFEYGDIKKKEDSSKSNHMSFNDFYTDQEKCIRQLMENLGVNPIAEVVKTEPTTDDASTAATSELATDDATASTAAIGTDESTEQTLF